MRLLIWQAIRICSLFIISGYFLNSLASYFMTKFLSAFYDPKGVLRRVYLRRFFLPIFLQTCKKIGYSCKNALLFELWRFYNQLCTILVRTSGNRCGTRLCDVLETASIDHARRDFPKFALHSKSVVRLIPDQGFESLTLRHKSTVILIELRWIFYAIMS